MPWKFYNSSGELQINDGGVSATAATITNDLTINSGNLVIGTAGKGIDFSNQASPAGTMTSELLDHYEEGTWTAQLWDNSNGAGESVAYEANGQIGFYQRIGNRVFYNFRIYLSDLGTLTTSQNAKIGGLPFQQNATTASNSGGSTTYIYGLNSGAATNIMMMVEPGGAAALTLYQSSAGNADAVLVSEVSSDGLIQGAGHYMV